MNVYVYARIDAYTYIYIYTAIPQIGSEDPEDSLAERVSFHKQAL